MRLSPVSPSLRGQAELALFPMLLNGKLFPLLIATAVVWVAFGHWLSFVSSPLGQSPVLDARENLVWAERIAAGDLPAEPFYRAPGYPAVLAALDWLTGGVPLPVIGSFFGLLLHLLNAGLVAGIASRLWNSRRAAWLAGAIYGLYPVSLYFAVQLFDITLGISLFLGAVLAMTGRKPSAHGGRVGEVSAGILLGLAVLVRPHFLLPALALPVGILLWPTVAKVAGRGGPGAEVLCYGRRHSAFGLRSAARVGIPLLALLLLQGLLNLGHGGEFRILPWQGAYNLYTANKTDANGRYFVQSVYFDKLPPGQNPTRRESELLYGRESGEQPPFGIRAMNTHWRNRTLAEVSEDPLAWLGLLGRKIVFLLNDWEQYNNLSYGFHKERAPWLRWNPLGWALLLVFGGVGWLAVLRGPQWRRTRGLVVLMQAAAYGLGVVLFFASARFRLPLVPVLAIGLGGLVPLAREFWEKRDMRLGLVALVSGAGLALISFPDWLNARDTSTYVQDEILLATAAMEVGDDRLALEQAEHALVRDPSRPDAMRLAMASRYNLLLAGVLSHGEVQWQRLRELHARLPEADAVSDFIAAVALWQSGNRHAAVEAWRSQVQAHGRAADSSAKALQVVGAERFFPEEDREMLLLRNLLR